MIPIIGIPILNRGDLLLRLFDSIDYPVDTVHILVNYTKALPDPTVITALEHLQKTADRHPFVKNITVEFGELLDTDKKVISHNMGVAGSWNRIMQTYPEASFIMLVGNDIKFTPGDLEKFGTFMSGLTPEERNAKGITCGNQGYSCFAIMPEAVKNIGYFDENIYPAYLEDCDYSWRCKQAGAHNNDVPDTHLIHGEAPSWGSSTIYSNDEYRRKNGHTHGLNFTYYVEKWGGNNGEEKYTSPYNDNTKPITYWRLYAARMIW